MVTAETIGPHLLPQCVHAIFPGDAVLAVYDHLVRNLAEQSRHSLCRIVVPIIHAHTVVGRGGLLGQYSLRSNFARLNPGHCEPLDGASLP